MSLRENHSRAGAVRDRRLAAPQLAKLRGLAVTDAIHVLAKKLGTSTWIVEECLTGGMLMARTADRLEAAIDRVTGHDR